MDQSIGIMEKQSRVQDLLYEAVCFMRSGDADAAQKAYQELSYLHESIALLRFEQNNNDELVWSDVFAAISSAGCARDFARVETLCSIYQKLAAKYAGFSTIMEIQRLQILFVPQKG